VELSREISRPSQNVGELSSLREQKPQVISLTPQPINIVRKIKENVMRIQRQIDEIKTKLIELEEQLKVESEIKPVFPNNKNCICYIVNKDGCFQEYSESNCHQQQAAMQGGTAYSKEDAQEIINYRAARARCIEAINIVNKKDNGFKFNKDNYFLHYCYLNKVICTAKENRFHSLDSWEYIRTEEAAKKLIHNPKFITDLKTVKGITYKHC